MAWVDQLRGQTVGLDTAPIIYYVEEHGSYMHKLDPFFDALELGRFQALTSTVTLVEVLTRPLRNGDFKLAGQYRGMLTLNRDFMMRPVSADIAEEAARLRASYKLGTPDAIQLATAELGGASHFLTNDSRLSRVLELQVLILDELE